MVEAACSCGSALSYTIDWGEKADFCGLVFVRMAPSQPPPQIGTDNTALLVVLLVMGIPIVFVIYKICAGLKVRPLSVVLSVCPSDCPSDSLYLSVCLSIYLSLCLATYPSVCPLNAEHRWTSGVAQVEEPRKKKKSKKEDAEEADDPMAWFAGKLNEMAMAREEAKAAKTQEAKGLTPDDLWNMLDLNKDGLLSMGEFKKGVQKNDSLQYLLFTGNNPDVATMKAVFKKMHVRRPRSRLQSDPPCPRVPVHNCCPPC